MGDHSPEGTLPSGNDMSPLVTGAVLTVQGKDNALGQRLFQDEGGVLGVGG